MLKTYYTPSPEEFHAGFLYEHRPIMLPSLTRGEFQKETIVPGRYDYIMLELTKDDVIRVQHLHEDDFKEIGLTCNRVSAALGEQREGYLCEATIKHPRFANCKLKVYYTPVTKWSLITINDAVVSAGTTMNINELKRVLKQVQADEIIKE